jgi:hypothetical protein
MIKFPFNVEGLLLLCVSILAKSTRSVGTLADGVVRNNLSLRGACDKSINIPLDINSNVRRTSLSVENFDKNAHPPLSLQCKS